MGLYDVYVPSEPLHCFHCKAELVEGFQGKDAENVWQREFRQGVKHEECADIITGCTFYDCCAACGAWNTWAMTVVDGVWVSSARDQSGCFMPPGADT